MDYQKLSLEKHYAWQGKLEVRSRVKVDSKEMLSLAYTPGVAAPCLEIKRDPDLSYALTRRANTVAVVSDGSAVLGLGNIGPLAGMPVMEGKCVLFKEFADIDAIPIVLNTQDSDELVKIISALSTSFGGINLEDIAAPRCFEIEARLKKIVDIPVFHDDQHGTAIVLVAALKNALKVVKKDILSAKIVINGAGSAGIAISKFLLSIGANNLTVLDRAGIICDSDAFNPSQRELAKIVNPFGVSGTLYDAIKGADVFIGVSTKDVLSFEMVRSMAQGAIVFAMANPDPEIDPALAVKAGARIVATGRSDLPNQINNVLAFPGIFRGALDVRAKDINEQMKIAAAEALAELIDEKELSEINIIPKAFDPRVVPAVAKAVAKAAKDSGVARI